MICLCATTRRAARLLTQMYEEALRPANLTPAQFELVATLAQRPGISQSKLAEELALDQTTLSRNLKPLLARGVIGRSPAPRDRRETIYTLTAAGNANLIQAMPLWKSAHVRMQGLLGKEFEPTVTTLTRLAAATQRRHAEVLAPA